MERFFHGKRFTVSATVGLGSKLFFGVAVCLSAVAVGADAAGNLRTNGDFEQGFAIKWIYV